MDEFEEVNVEEELEQDSMQKTMTRKLAVILFASLFTVLIIVVDSHRDFNLLLTSRLIQILFVLSFSVVFYAKFAKIKNKRLFREVVDTASIIQVFLLLFSIVNYQFLSISTVEGSSMEPSYQENDNILISHVNSEYERFDVVVIKMDSKVYYIKRVIGLPGDYVEVIDNQLFINGYLQEQDFLAEDAITVCDVFGETSCSFLVPEGEYFVLGDNRQYSEDSRVFGTISEAQIEGKVVYQFQTLLD